MFFPFILLVCVDKKEDGSIPPAVVMPVPSKRGRKKKSMMPRAAHALATGSDALILAHLAAGGQVRCSRGVVTIHTFL